MKREPDDNHNEPISDKVASPLDRRTYLKLAGTTATVAAVATGQSSAATTGSYGYGEGGYGNGPYGGTSTFSVQTQAPSSIGAASAVLEGSLEDLEGAESATCSFEWRKSGTSVWNRTAEQQLTALGSFSADLSGLEGGTTYEYRAVGAASDGDSDVGSTTGFTTDISNTGPKIQSYSVTEAGSPNPHIQITADWTVADSDGNLDTVVLEAIDSTGSPGDVSTVEVGGSTASGTSTLDVKHVGGQAFDIVITVIDTHGQDSTETKTVTE